MKSLLSISLGVVVLFIISSCATTTPLSEGELRLLRIDVPENGNLIVGHDYRFNIRFEADGNPDIVKAVCICGDSRLQAYQLSDLRYGTKGNFSIWVFPYSDGSQRLECYAEYLKDGKKHRSTSVFAIINGLIR